MAALFLQDTALRYFLEVVRSGSISEAANKLCVSPSAVSRQIAGLEDQLGAALFERRPRGMVPSPAGERLAVHAQRNALESERVFEDIQALKGLRRGLVRMASAAGFGLEFMPQAIAAFQKLHPGIQFELRTYSSRAVSTAVLHGDADLGLTYSRTPVQGIRVEHRQAAEVLVIMRPDHALARHHRLTLAQLAPYPLALPDPENTVREAFDIACSQRGIQVQPVLVGSSFESLMSYVQATGSLSISGELTVRHRIRRGELHGAPLTDRQVPLRHVELQSLGERQLPPAVESFAAFLRQALPVDPAV